MRFFVTLLFVCFLLLSGRLAVACEPGPRAEEPQDFDPKLVDEAKVAVIGMVELKQPRRILLKVLKNIKGSKEGYSLVLDDAYGNCQTARMGEVFLRIQVKPKPSPDLPPSPSQSDAAPQAGDDGKGTPPEERPEVHKEVKWRKAPNMGPLYEFLNNSRGKTISPAQIEYIKQTYGIDLAIKAQPAGDAKTATTPPAGETQAASSPADDGSGTPPKEWLVEHFKEVERKKAIDRAPMYLLRDSTGKITSPAMAEKVKRLYGFDVNTTGR
ncbi:MAG: hypothetical protein EPN97_00660 [Alphaproteobacteria bacterium]|nr:MAG: hypothetical protein EPN97_00660 [Alphaproteobacteria bacterium]